MALNSVLTLLTLILLLTTTTTATTTNTDVISTIVSAGNFENWATILSSNPSFLPPNLTLFLPLSTTKNATKIPQHKKQNPFSTIFYDNHDLILYENYNNSSSFTKITQELQSYFLLLYHIVPYRLSFDDLIRFPVDTNLPTLLPGYTILVKANKNQNGFSCNVLIAGSCVSRPEIYQDETAFVHGIEAAVDYTSKPIEKNTISWTELWLKIWASLVLLGAYWLFFFNPFQLFPPIFDFEDDDDDDDSTDDSDDDFDDDFDDDSDDDFDDDDGISEILVEVREIRRKLMEVEKEFQRQDEEKERRKKEDEEEKKKWEEYERQMKIEDELEEKERQEEELRQKRQEETEREWTEENERWWQQYELMERESEKHDEELRRRYEIEYDDDYWDRYCQE